MRVFSAKELGYGQSVLGLGSLHEVGRDPDGHVWTSNQEADAEQHVYDHAKTRQAVFGGIFPVHDLSPQQVAILAERHGVEPELIMELSGEPKYCKCCKCKRALVRRPGKPLCGRDGIAHRLGGRPWCFTCVHKYNPDGVPGVVYGTHGEGAARRDGWIRRNEWDNAVRILEGDS